MQTNANLYTYIQSSSSPFLRTAVPLHISVPSPVSHTRLFAHPPIHATPLFCNYPILQLSYSVNPFPSILQLCKPYSVNQPLPYKYIPYFVNQHHPQFYNYTLFRKTTTSCFSLNPPNFEMAPPSLAIFF